MLEYSDQAIDFRPYIKAVLNKWYWILAAGIAAAILAFVLGSLGDPTYEATAVVAIANPSQIVQFDPRIQTLSQRQPFLAYPDLALNDELLGKMRDQMPNGSKTSLRALRKQLHAEPGIDPSILKLTAIGDDPEGAATLANTWAELLVNWANQFYGDQGDDQLSYFEAQLDESDNELESAEQALIEFQAYNRSSILDNELLALQQAQIDNLAKQRQTDLILQDVDSLSAQERNFDSGQASIGQLASLLLQIRALGGVPNSNESAMPWQIQLNMDGQSNLSASEQREIIFSLRELLLAQSVQIEERLTDLEAQLLSVQQQKQEANALENRLIRDIEVAEETYTTLSRNVDEKRITSQDTTSGVKLVSQSAVPEAPMGRGRLRLAVVAGFLGLAIGTIIVLAKYIWDNAELSADKP